MLVFSAIIFASAIVSTSFAGQLSFQSGEVLVEWTNLPGSQEIEFNLTMKTTAWIGLGISKENSGMKKLDCYAGGYNAGTYLKDYYADAKTMPTQDTTQSATLITATENNGKTNLRFKRKLDTGDVKDTKITPGEKLYLVWAYGSSDTFGYHGGNRGYSGLVTLVDVSSTTVAPSSTIAPTAASTPEPTPSVAPTTVAPTTVGPSQDKELMFSKGRYNVSWEYNSNAEEVTFNVTVKGTGWIGFGFSESNTQMKDIDIAIAIVKSSSQKTVEDYFSTETKPPPKDDSQDFTFIKASQDNGITSVMFKRKLKTNDAKDIEIVVGKSYYVAWAYDPTKTTFGYHNALRGYSKDKKVFAAGKQPTVATPTTTGACVKVSSILLLLSMLVAMFG